MVLLILVSKKSISAIWIFKLSKLLQQYSLTYVYMNWSDNLGKWYRSYYESPYNLRKWYRSYYGSPYIFTLDIWIVKILKMLQLKTLYNSLFYGDLYYFVFIYEFLFTWQYLLININTSRKWRNIATIKVFTNRCNDSFSIFGHD